MATAGVATGLAGCSSGSAGAAVSPAPGALDPACVTAFAALPATVLGQARTPLAVSSNAAKAASPVDEVRVSVELYGRKVE